MCVCVLAEDGAEETATAPAAVLGNTSQALVHFSRKLRSNIRVVMLFSALDDSFRRCAGQFPAILNSSQYVTPLR